LTNIRPQIIDSAPGKELFCLIRDERNVVAFREFYELRKVWCGGYPLIHDFGTYGAYSDLMYDPVTEEEFSTDVKLAMLAMAVEIALNESDEFFYCALALLAEVIPNDRILPRPKGFGDALMKLGERFKNGHFHGNAIATWESLVTKSRCLKPSEPDRSYDEHKALKSLEIYQPIAGG
jgi:hypothetical protein